MRWRATAKVPWSWWVPPLPPRAWPLQVFIRRNCSVPAMPSWPAMIRWGCSPGRPTSVATERTWPPVWCSPMDPSMPRATRILPSSLRIRPLLSPHRGAAWMPLSPASGQMGSSCGSPISAAMVTIVRMAWPAIVMAISTSWVRPLRHKGWPPPIPGRGRSRVARMCSWPASIALVRWNGARTTEVALMTTALRWRCMATRWCSSPEARRAHRALPWRGCKWPMVVEMRMPSWPGSSRTVPLRPMGCAPPPVVVVAVVAVEAVEQPRLVPAVHGREDRPVAM